MFEDQELMDLKTYSHINKEISSEMFCSVMTCFHHYLPCTGVVMQLKNAFKSHNQSTGGQALNSPMLHIASPLMMNSVAKYVASPQSAAAYKDKETNLKNIAQVQNKIDKWKTQNKPVKLGVPKKSKILLYFSWEHQVGEVNAEEQPQEDQGGGGTQRRGSHGGGSQTAITPNDGS